MVPIGGALGAVYTYGTAGAASALCGRAVDLPPDDIVYRNKNIAASTQNIPGRYRHSNNELVRGRYNYIDKWFDIGVTLRNLHQAFIFMLT